MNRRELVERLDKVDAEQREIWAELEGQVRAPLVVLMRRTLCMQFELAMMLREVLEEGEDE